MTRFNLAHIRVEDIRISRRDHLTKDLPNFHPVFVRGTPDVQYGPPALSVSWALPALSSDLDLPDSALGSPHPVVWDHFFPSVAFLGDLGALGG